MATEAHLTELLQGYLKDPAKAARLHELLDSADMEQSVRDTLFKMLSEEKENERALDKLHYDGLFEAIVGMDKPESQMVPPVHQVHFLRTAWFRYAAIFLLIAGTVTLVYRTSRHTETARKSMPAKATDILPGGNKAVLTLADGSKIVLDSAADGSVAQQGGTTVLKLGAGSLAYHPAGSGELIGYNTVSTPRGGQYQIVLPDGSRVWLNAASALTFPTSFAEKERRVEVMGEAYFEIATDKSRPFLVKINDRTEVQVLGTQFNVNAYKEEKSVKTTLLTGSVRIHSGKQLQVLQPGQQAQIGDGGQLTVINPDLNQVIAWKNGLFNFNGYDVKTLMQEISRWYNVDIEYASTPEPREIRGKMERDLNLSQVLAVLKDLDINCHLAGKTLVVEK